MRWLPSLVLGGCQGLAGSWTGPLVCLEADETIDGQAAVTLVADRGGELAGELRAEGEHVSAAGRQELVLAWELELERTSPSGRQELTARIDDCVRYVGGQLEDQACPAGEATWLWDGADSIEMQGEDCTLSLVR
ncbi:hypothetical protein L6R53_10225 [Myxococcota bacterium]|nr:hypothetical protein [Myxococcota bacterium]